MAASVAIVFGFGGCVKTRTKIVAPSSAGPTVPVPMATEPESSRREAEGPTAIRMRNVDLHVAPGVVLHVRSLRGEAVSIPPGQPIVFDDKRSFSIRIATGDAGVTMPDLGRLMNGYVFAYEGTPLSDIKVATYGNQLRLRATLHKGGDVPVEIVGNVSATPNGEVRLRPTSIKVAKVSAGPLLKLVGLKLEKLVSLRGSRGARIAGNDIFLEPDSIVPPPTIHGHLTAARIEGEELRLTFDDPSIAPLASAADAPPDTTGNYLYFRRGTLRIGKLFMVHADLEIMDENPSDPLDFDLGEYVRQLVAGFVKNTEARGLIVHSPDLKALNARNAGAPTTAEPNPYR
jgi:hypothetical protein